MTDRKLLCQYVQEDGIKSMGAFLLDHPNSELINERCNITNMITLGNGISADVVFGTELPPLLFATAKDNEQMMHAILENSNVVEIDAVGIYGDTSLIISALYGNFYGTRLLLEYGADVNLGDEHNNTALHKVASGSNFREVTATSYYSQDYINTAELLLSNGAKIDAIAYGEGQPDGAAINVAVKYKNFDMVRLLSENNADVTIQDSNGKIALCEISKSFNIDEATSLIQFTDITYKDPICNPIIEGNICLVDANYYEQICNNGLSSKCVDGPSSISDIVIGSLVLPFFPVTPAFVPTALGAIVGGMIGSVIGCCNVDGFNFGNGAMVGGFSVGLLRAVEIAGILYEKYTDDCIET
ncbi:MAG: ankyrin repeat domain-containing protein [Rickettsiales bacterium]|nr:ankyrin repeat domain-containing protein [Rickettsiales bacterium]